MLDTIKMYFEFIYYYVHAVTDGVALFATLVLGIGWPYFLLKARAWHDDHLRSQAEAKERASRRNFPTYWAGIDAKK